MCHVRSKHSEFSLHFGFSLGLHISLYLSFNNSLLRLVQTFVLTAFLCIAFHYGALCGCRCRSDLVVASLRKPSYAEVFKVQLYEPAFTRVVAIFEKVYSIACSTRVFDSLAYNACFYSSAVLTFTLSCRRVKLAHIVMFVNS